MKYYIEYFKGFEPTIGSYWTSKYECTDTMEECDVFINNLHDRYSQVHRLFQAAEMNKRIINIGSISSNLVIVPIKDLYFKDIDFKKYILQKKALSDANDSLFVEGINTTIINFGFVDTQRTESVADMPKISLEYVDYIIHWVLEQPYRIKEISVAETRN